MKRICLLVLLPFLFTGCATTITNLTPNETVRNPDGLYPFEVIWDSTQESIREQSLQAYVIIGLEAFPMQRTPLLKNRWEALVPIPANENYVNYRYKFDFLYDSIPRPKESSKLSNPYQLHIIDQPR